MIRSLSRRRRCARASAELVLDRVERDRLEVVERERLLVALRLRLLPLPDDRDPLRVLPLRVPPLRFAPLELEPLDRLELDRPELDFFEPPLLACGMLPPLDEPRESRTLHTGSVDVQSAAA